MQKPNLLVILCDQLRRQALGQFGGPVPTPNLDQLAAEGVSFSQAYTNNPMCTPARAAMLTGRYPHALRDEHNRPYWYNDRLLDVDECGIAKSLTQAGYSCGYIGKMHTDRGGSGTHVPAGPRRHGFDDFWAGYHAAHPHAAPFYFKDNGERMECGNVWEPVMQTELALQHISESIRRDKPFFLHLSYGPPHTPFTLPDDKQYLLARARELNLPLSPNVPPEVAEAAREESIQYHANVMGLDEVMGRLLSGLKESGAAENTIVVFTSDHGSQLFNHGLREKNQFFEEAVAIPFICRWPERVQRGVVSPAFLHLTDLAPTLLELCGVPVPERMQGRSLAPVLLGRAEQGPHPLAYLEANLPLWDFTFGQGPQGNRRCIITDEWKLVLIESRDGYGVVTPAQLFNRRNDPHEMRNLAADPGCQWAICQLVKQALPVMKRTEDPFWNLMMFGHAEAR
jgi:arylsulfatase A-like enzyme